jgi:hypothetical protein
MPPEYSFHWSRNARPADELPHLHRSIVSHATPPGKTFLGI